MSPLSDADLVAAIRAGNPGQDVVDEYYRRCIPIYLDFLGPHWHTGFYLDDGAEVGPEDQVRMVRHVADAISLRAGERVLDVGCGVGATLACLARDVGVDAVGLTPVEDQRRAARALQRQSPSPCDLRIDLGHAGALPYDNDSFDAVLFFESPCHFPDRRAFFAEAFRVLKPGGRLAGEDWLATGADGDGARWLEPVCRTWAIPSLGTGAGYLQLAADAGFVDGRFVDLRTEMALERGFAVHPAQQRELERERQSCPEPLWALALEGLLRLGEAVAAGAFTIGCLTARKPA